eukprot:scaffold55987_cov72-Phaeocystis_antarctica.AAC.2
MRWTWRRGASCYCRPGACSATLCDCCSSLKPCGSATPSYVCVNVVGGGYDFAKVKTQLLSLSSELPPSEVATLRTELMAHGNGVGQLGITISNAVPNVISVFFNPAASDVMMEAAI